MAKHIRKGDTVEVIAGKYKGQQGKIIEVLTRNDRVRVEGVGVVKRHLKPGQDQKVPQGGIIEKVPSIHASNVLPVDPSTGKATRVGYQMLDNGEKVRVARRSGEVFAD